MKKIFVLGIIIFGLQMYSQAQNVNWRLDDRNARHLVALHIGLDYGTVYGVSYGYRFRGNFPLVLGTEISIPFGETVFDDWKVKFNAQTELWHSDRLSWSIKPGLIARGYRSDAAHFYNVGVELGSSFGYYGSGWGIAAEGSYDRNGATYVKHQRLRDYYPEITDGWIGSTGGNFKFGLAGTYAFSTWNLHLGAGTIYGQNFKDNPTLPYYFDLSLQKFLQ